jgi:uncharacterized protein
MPDVTGAPCWIELFTSDTERCIDFYAQLFGWKADVAGPEYGGYITFVTDDQAVGGCMHNDGTAGAPNSWNLYLSSNDVRRTAEAATAHGGQIIVEPMQVGEMGHFAFVLDAGGAAVGIWQGDLQPGFAASRESGTGTWFELLTRDYDTSVAFYRDVFGWDTHVMSDTDDFRYTTLGEGDDALAGIMDATSFLPEGVPPHWRVYVGVDDTDATIAKIVELGGTLLRPAEDTPYGRLAQVADPTGAAFMLVAG